MSSAPPPTGALTPELATCRRLVDEYAAAHGVAVRLWRRENDAWSIEHPTGESAGGPSAAMAPVNFPVEVELYVELPADEGDARAQYLAGVLERAIGHEAESHFFGRELAERYEEITLLYSISEILGSVISLEEAAITILREVVDTMSVSRAALWLYEPESDTLRLVAAVGGNGQSGPVSIHDESSMTAAVFRSRTPMILEPGDIFPRADLYPSGTHRDSFLSVPVSYTPPRGESRTIGVINLIGRSVQDGFSAGDQKLIAAIASQVGAAVENSRLVAESLRQERMVRELELAHDLQLKLLPSLDDFEEVGEVAARCAPADSVGGDFYHLFHLPNGSVGVMIGDVSSHGFGAALIMALAMSAAAIHAAEGDPPSEVLRRVHRALIDELESTEMYLTLFYGVIDARQGVLRYANAGHPHAFVIADDGEVTRLATTNPPLGLVDLDTYGEESIAWKAREDILFLFTDGLSDAISASDGADQLTRVIAQRRAEPLAETLEFIFDPPAERSGTPADDRTALLLRV